MYKSGFCIIALCILLLGSSCSNDADSVSGSDTTAITDDSIFQYAQQRIGIYDTVRLTTDLNVLTENERKMLPLLIQAAKIMDDLFWHQAYGKRDSLMNALSNRDARRFARINYGPWDRLNNDTPFVAGVGTKPPGANFYPSDMTKEELMASDVSDKLGAYSLIMRDARGKLASVPYHVAYEEQLKNAAGLLKQAAELAEDPQLKNYLLLRANALVTSKYTDSDIAWLDMKQNTIDIIIGPIENYEDKLFNARTSFEAYVLVKDKEWSNRLAKYVAMLPELQQGLPVGKNYKSETPGTESELNAYDVVYYAGDCNAGSKTIAVNLPNDEQIQQTKGTRRSQLKNAMRAKFDRILLPISQTLIDTSQLSRVNFDAFFSNVMFHEVAHGLGIKHTINGKGTVRAALQEQSSWLEEAKADVLGLYMVTSLVEKGELDGELEDYYTTFMAGILRSVRFGAASAHGKANMLCFNFFLEQQAFEQNEDGRYRVNYTNFRTAMNKLSEKILMLQGNGDKEGVTALQKEKAVIKPELQASLEKLKVSGIPVDIVFEQGESVLGIQ